MKTKILVVCFIFIFGMTALAVIGQTSQTVSIKFGSPPAEMTPCEVRFSSLGDSLFYEVLVPTAFQPRIVGARIEASVEGNKIVFPFLLKRGSTTVATRGSCEVSMTEFRIVLTGASGDVIGISEGDQTTPTPSPTPNLTPKASEEEVEEKKKETDEDVLDMSIPESPGFTILGLTPQEVTRPATPRDFATAIINSIDRYGNLQSGIAIDTAPYRLLRGKQLTIIKYRERYWERFLARTQFSLATTKGTTEDDKSARVGAGLNFTLFDFGDPTNDKELDKCYQAINKRLEAQARADFGLDPNGTDVPFHLRRTIPQRMRVLLSETFETEYVKCSEAAKKRNFGRSSFGVGLAGSWISKDGDSSKFTNNGQGLWASLAYGFEGTGFRCTQLEIEDKKRCITPQLIFHFRRRVKEAVPDPFTTGAFTTKDSNLFGTRLRLGVPKWSVNFEGVYRAERYAGQTSSSSIEASLGADYKLAKNLYLNFSVGGATKESNIPGGGKVFVRTAFNWGTSQKPLD